MNNSSYLEKGTKILINSQGYVSNKNNSRFDGITYFGYYDESKLRTPEVFK